MSKISSEAESLEEKKYEDVLKKANLELAKIHHVKLT